MGVKGEYEMSLSIPIYFCIMKDEPITPQGYYATRVIQSIKCEWDDLDRLYTEYQSQCYSNVGWYARVYTRGPDETPMKSKVEMDDKLGQSILDLRDAVALLEKRLNQELTWKDQLAEDNRILREKLDIPDSHFKFVKPVEGNLTTKDVDKWIDENFPVETQPKREYNDW